MPGVVQPLGENAFLQELFLQLPQQLIQQVVGLVNQADKRVSSYLGGGLFNIGPIGQIGPIFVVSQFPDNPPAGRNETTQRKNNKI